MTEMGSQEEMEGKRASLWVRMYTAVGLFTGVRGFPRRRLG